MHCINGCPEKFIFKNSKISGPGSCKAFILNGHFVKFKYFRDKIYYKRIIFCKVCKGDCIISQSANRQRH
jgi:hypothetical protein